MYQIKISIAVKQMNIGSYHLLQIVFSVAWVRETTGS